MFTLPIRTWICNAAAVLSSRPGAVTERAQEAGCRRETVYEQACKVEHRLAHAAAANLKASALAAENQRLRDQGAALRLAAPHDLIGAPVQPRQVAVTAVAMGLSLRQIEDLLKLRLPPSQAPDPARIGRWVQTQAEQAGTVLEVLDAAGAPRVPTLAIDESCCGGDRPWSASSPRAGQPSFA